MFGSFLNPFPLGNLSTANKTVKIRRRSAKAVEPQGFSRNILDHGDLTSTVAVPPGETLEEWLAVNTVDFFNQTNLLYGTISEFCTKHSCKVMSAGEKYEYLWIDHMKYKKSTKLSACEYIQCMCEWVAGLLNDPDFFPADSKKFPPNFIQTVRTIFRRLFRVYGHLYYSHFEQIRKLDVHRHLNTCFTHFSLFSKEFELVSVKDMDPLRPTILLLVPDYFKEKIPHQLPFSSNPATTTSPTGSLKAAKKRKRKSKKRKHKDKKKDDEKKTDKR